jgi:MFS family permease
LDSSSENARPELARNIVVMGLSSMVATFGNTLWYYFLPIYYSKVFGATPLQISIIYAFWLAIGAFGSSPAGALADAYGRKPVIVFSSIVSAVAIFIFAFSKSLLISAIALPIVGLGSSFFMVSYTLVAESVQKKERGSAFGKFSMMTYIAAAFSPLVGGLTISASGYFPLFLFGGILTIIAAVIRILFVRETLPESERTKLSSLGGLSGYFRSAKGILKNRLLLTLLFAYSIYNLFASQTSFITPLYASEALGYGAITTGALFSALLAIVAISRLPFGKLSDKIGREKTIMISWIGEISLVYVFVFATSFPIAIAGIGLWMLFGVMDSPAINAWVAEASDPKTRGLSMGVFYTVTFIPSIPALVASGYLFSIKPQLPFYANTAVSLIALLILLVFSRSSKPKPPVTLSLDK